MVKGLPTGWGACSRIVRPGHTTVTLTCWKDSIAVGLGSGDIIILDGITGSQTATLSGHPRGVRSLAFFSDGTSLVSGSDDMNIKLWDMQTGGVIKTFCGHTNYVRSVSISSDCTVVASGSDDKTIRLWDIWMEECHHVIEQQDFVVHVRFSPTDPQCIISVSGDKVWYWNINGHQTNHVHNGFCIAFSLDGAQFVSCHGEDIVVQNSSSGRIVAKFHVANSKIQRCCFSPDGKLIATAADKTAHVWDITSPQSHPIKTFVGHTNYITSLAYFSPSSLVSSSYDGSVRFWEISATQADPVVPDLESTSFTSAQIVFITLQAEDGIAISSDLGGVVRTWDISTGLCKASFHIPAISYILGDVRLINSSLIFVWSVKGKIHIWNVEKGELLQIIDATWGGFDIVADVRISGDGSKVFCLHTLSIQAWSIQTGELVSEMSLVYCASERSLIVGGSRVWVHCPWLNPLGWDFGTPGSPPVQLLNPPLLLPNNPLHVTTNAKLWDIKQSMIKDAVTGRVVFQLPGRFAKPVKSQWDGRYLVTGYKFGEVLILDFNHVHF